MAPKVNCNPQKLTAIQSWFRKSKTVWNLKELEKQIPSIGSINSMQTKDYIQSLQDDNRISCEKIGSGNWYWSFPSEQAKNVDSAYSAAEAEFEKIQATTLEFKNKLDEKASAIQAEMDAAESDGPDRGELEVRKLCLTEEIEKARKELASYKDNDPTELDNMKKELKADYDFAEMATDDIYSMESWFKKQGADEAVKTFPDTYYKPLDQWNEEEGGFYEEILDGAMWAPWTEESEKAHDAVLRELGVDEETIASREEMLI